MALKVAIVGLAESSHHLAPWNDLEWELWGLAWDVDCYRFHRTFDPHDLGHLLAAPPLPNYIERLEMCANLYMQEAYPEVQGAQRYPVEDIAKTIGADYFCSSIGFAMAMAIHEGAEEIGLYGVDMKAHEEYFYQRPNLEYLIGFARGKGIKVHIPDSSPLAKFQTDPDFEYAGRYGRAYGSNH